jgi:prolyl 4-hydroxylase
VIVFDNFMSDEECDGLIEQARPRMERSSVVQPMTGASMVNDIRTSTGMFFKAAESELVARIEKRIERLVHWPVENGEAIQVLNYQQGAEYQPHQDYFDPSDPGTPNSLGLSGQRVGTVLMYLNTPVRGGGTMFPEAGIEVKAKKGRAVLFSYSRPSPAMRTLHGGMPVLEGEKWAATKWLRQRPFQPLGVPQPPKATF